MTSPTSIKSLLQPGVPLDSEVRVQGWVRTKRGASAELAFVAVHDGSCFAPMQVVCREEVLDNFANDIATLTSGCSVDVTGVLIESKGKGQTVEIDARSVTVVGGVEDPETYPMQPKRHSLEFLRENAHLRVRTNMLGAVARVRNCLSQAVHRYFHENGYLWVHTPIITANDAEGAGNMFHVSTLDKMNIPLTDKGEVNYTEDFFGQPTHLTVSGQLNVETYCCALSKVYTFGPTFRAENSHTRRHLAEFWMIEPELAFADLSANADLAESFLKYIFSAVLNECADDMAFFAQRVNKEAITRLQHFVDSGFERMTYTEAIGHLGKAKRKWDHVPTWGSDLQSEHERYLAEDFVGRPVVVTDYPAEIKAFYMRFNDDGKTVAAMDILAAGVGELVGGSQREERLDVLDDRIRHHKLNPEDYWWYRDLRKYGTVPHAGFGLGFDRAVQFATGVENIRDVIPFPRAKNSADF
ncbi:MAG: asparaginyl-tRNA synthetase [Bradymonadia bacterium]|jgi:asparaginyl-tRNA synthetase